MHEIVEFLISLCCPIDNEILIKTHFHFTLQEDEEWVDFEQETEKDYSGLRIQNLQISKEDADQEEENKENENNDDEDENGEKRDVMSGPWNKSSAQPQTAPPPQPKVEEKPPPAEPVAKTPGKYVPPSLRGGASASPSEPTRPTPLRKKKVAPNLQSEEDFPTLGGGGGPGAEPSGGMSFEKVQSGNRMADDPSKLQSLTLGNKFSALQD
ncbi:hypothetical protein FSP39_011195 [Pinctada imbricata]|uniref:Uncharacterized protein n=1 Tax=Pinctada imbricata TaxID=66713 RepID=A0AA88YJA8_PINIB|nr:hypothetical protein FSP39_011195 [Pinctada imbricata]